VVQKSKKITLDKLPDLLGHLLNDYCVYSKRNAKKMRKGYARERSENDRSVKKISTEQFKDKYERAEIEIREMG